MIWSVCTVLAWVIGGGGAGLAPPALIRLPVGSIAPKGWLLQQLTLQGEGLSGHLSQFWEDVMSSVWIGGTADGGLHERAPYWLDGIVPLAYLLQSANVTELPGSSGLYLQRGPARCAGVSPAAEGTTCEKLPPVHPVEQARNYVAAILQQQNQSTGWIGPNSVEGSDFPGDMYWPATNVLLALGQYAEAEPQEFEVVSAVMISHLLEMRQRLRTTPLAPKPNSHLSTDRRRKEPAGAVAFARWVDIADSIVWVLDHGVGKGYEPQLVELFHTLKSQGQDWDGDFMNEVGGYHNVNVAEGLKSAAIEYRFSSGNASDTAQALMASRARMKELDVHYGLPTGMFIGDEMLPSAPSHDPSRGVELCGVVEAMHSYEVMFMVHGEPEFADRAERIAYNALPSTWASPRGGDMWAHQYFQSVNQIKAINGSRYYWPTNGTGPDATAAEMYGLSPNYGCCTANFNQGWPKFATSIAYTTPDDGIAIGLWAPSRAKTKLGEIDIETTYPFGDDAVVTVSARQSLPLYLRIPGWAVDATVNGVRAPNGTMYKVACPSGVTVVRVAFAPRVRLEHSTETSLQAGAYSVHRGALMYSLPLGLNYTLVHHYVSEANDYSVQPTSRWAFALDANPLKPESALLFEAAHGYVFPRAPFNQTGWPNYITASIRALPTWAEINNSAAPPPKSPACVDASAQCGPPVKAFFVPHGGTVLRVGMLPLSGLLPFDESDLVLL